VATLATLFFVPVVFSLLHRQAPATNNSIVLSGPGGVDPSLAGA
jgi:hypothetical protein